PGTPAANLRDGVEAAEKQRRLHILQSRVRSFDEAYKNSLVGTTQRVLVEKPATRGEGRLAGKASCNRWVNFEGPASLIGDFADVVVTQAMPNSMRGRLVGAPAVAA